MNLHHLYEQLAKRMEQRETFVPGSQPLVAKEMVSDRRFMYLSTIKSKNHDEHSNSQRQNLS